MALYSFEQIAQRLLAGNRINDLPHRVVRARQGGLGDAEEEAVLAGHAPEVRE